MARMVRREVLAFSGTERIVHWMHTAVFFLLLFTGMVLYVPAFSAFAIGPAGLAARMLHRLGAIAYLVTPLIYIIFDPWGLINSLREIFTWGLEDLGWLRASVAYYFFGEERAMPPQRRFNTGQKLFYDIVVITALFLGVTGMIMWFDKGTAPTVVSQWSVILHDIAAIAITAMFLVHFMLSTIHPLMEGALGSIVWGWMPMEYVQSHHRRWYVDIIGAIGEESTEESEEKSD